MMLSTLIKRGIKVPSYKIKKVIVLSYYHPWIAGGGHRPHQLALADLLDGKEVAFIFSNKTDVADIKQYVNRPEYKNLSLYFYQSGVLESVTSSLDSIAIEEFTMNFKPDYVRAHNPAQEYLSYINFLNRYQKIFLYDQMDDWQYFKSQPWGDFSIERQYIENANLISTITDKLARSFKDKKVLTSPNAIRDDLIKFNAFETEHLEKSLFEKHVVYAGAMWPDWFDWELSFHLVEKLPQYKFTFIGSTNPPKDENHEVDTKRMSEYLASFANVELIPEVPHETLFNFFKFAHVGIIPFKVNQLTLGCSPLKAFDYMASGLPVVSSALVQMKDYPHFHYGDNFQKITEQLSKIDRRSFSTEDSKILKNFLNKNTWNYRIKELDQFIGEMLIA